MVHAVVTSSSVSWTGCSLCQLTVVTHILGWRVPETASPVLESSPLAPWLCGYQEV